LREECLGALARSFSEALLFFFIGRQSEYNGMTG
jgi:hypothetical protein